VHTILVLGGYGFFGARICSSLATHPNLRLLVAGRHAQRARAAAHSLSLAASQGRLGVVAFSALIAVFWLMVAMPAF